MDEDADAAPQGVQGHMAERAEAASEPTQSGKETDLPVTWAEYRATAALFAIFVAAILLAVAFAKPFLEANLQFAEDGGNVGFSALYLVMILAFTFVILWIAKYGKKWMIQAIILGAVAMTLVYVVSPLLALAFSGPVAWGLGLLVGIACAVALYVHPEWYVIDVVGLLVAAGAATIFGISLGPVPVVVLLVALAVYDAIAVYKTKHMLLLADNVIELRLPVLLVVPKTRGYSFRREAARFKQANESNKEDREAMFMGLGDLVMPTMLVVSALQFGDASWNGTPALGAAVGTLVGFSVLMGYVLKGRPQAGLPLLNGGSIVGFLTGLYAATGSLMFW